jgi:GAF domain-containing protein
MAWPAADHQAEAARPDTFAAALAELVHTLQLEGINDDLHALTVITQGAVGMIGGAEQAGIVVPAGPGLLDGRSAVGDLAPLVLKLQNQIGEGPCLDAVTQPAQLLVTDLRSDARWPVFAAQAVRWELRSVLCTPMLVGRNTVGSLTLLSTRPDAFDQDAASLAAVFAAHATLALTSLERIRNLQAMAASRQVVGRAEGILMRQHKIPAEEAFQMLMRTSQRSNIKLREICEHFISTGELRHR